jgi:hypothetical protein
MAKSGSFVSVEGFHEIYPSVRYRLRTSSKPTSGPPQARLAVPMSVMAILHHSKIRLSSQGAFPEHFAPEYGNQIDGEGNGQNPESRPRRSDSSQSTQDNLCSSKTWISSDETPSTLVRPLSQ